MPHDMRTLGPFVGREMPIPLSASCFEAARVGAVPLWRQTNLSLPPSHRRVKHFFHAASSWRSRSN